MKTILLKYPMEDPVIFRIKLVLLYILLVIATIATVYAQPDFFENQKSQSEILQSQKTEMAMDFPVAQKLPSYINTPLGEIRPMLSKDGKTLYFSRQHYPFNITGVFNYEDIWCSKFDENLNMWSRPVNIGPPVKNSGPNSVSFIELSGDTIVLTNEYKERGQISAGIYMSVLQNTDWSFLVPVGLVEHNKLSVDNEILTRCRRKVILNSMKNNDSYGRQDLYVTLVHPDGTAETKNLGNVINTRKDEIAPFLSDDQRTLYFASNGRIGFGGFDIYVSERLDETWQNWSEPRNLGPAINTSMDEESYYLPADGQYAYFIRQKSNRNTDIFQVAVPGPEHALIKTR